MCEEENRRRNPRGTRSHAASGGFGRGPLETADFHPLDLIAFEHDLQLCFCDCLERLADTLPEKPDANNVHGYVKILESGMQPHHKMEEDALFPLLRRRSRPDSSLAAACAELEKEHAEDHDLAIELKEELLSFASSGVARNPEMLGYMLRGYFAGQRRHIDWENSLILPLARSELLVDDLQALKTWITDTAHRQFTDLLRLVVSGSQGGSS